MTRPLQPEEREEVENLAYECETNPATLRAYLAELIRLRSFAATVKSCGRRLPPKVTAAIETCLTRPSRWLELWRATEQDKDKGRTANLF